ncbi:AAA family ATPase, partial [Streptomyces sp. NPDC058734]|uniref:AAA family ATPase n=1 Tax=Streptomyces sp. NPDC058734 TaxID=3346615 RepID=UPI0036C179E4
ALYGPPGAGKSTAAQVLTQELASGGVEVVRLRLADPLYEAQRAIYAMAGRPLTDDTRQDGRLLNLLGTEMRRINPDALTGPFTIRVRKAEDERPKALLLCDDLRAPDVETVTALGFRLLEINAPAALCRSRRRARGDLTAGDDNHPTEVPLTVEPWRRIDNNGDLAEYRERLAAVARELIA